MGLTVSHGFPNVFSPPDFLTVLRDHDLRRQAEWPADFEVDLMFRATELGGEVGELLGAVKKVFRHQHSIAGNGGDLERYIQNAREELGDVLVCLDLLAAKLEKDLGVPFDLRRCTIDKFNATTDKVGLTVKIEG